jgi:hypothetical protein
VNRPWRILKSGLRWSFRQPTVLSAAFLGLSLAAALPQAQPRVPVQTNLTASVTNSAPAKVALADLPIPQSVFINPTNQQEGRDPFYPRSTRPYGSSVVSRTNQVAVVPSVDLHLKGFSGPPSHRLAIINNHTFETGEEGEVITTAGRMRIRCLEIKDDSVVIQIGGERRTLRFRSGL